jgi:chemotaxis protein methyltransferase CheR
MSEINEIPAFQEPDWSEARLERHDFALLSEFIRNEVGIQLTPAKQVMLEGRLRKRLRALGLNDFSQYVARVIGPHRDEGEIIQLIDAVTTNKTDFFREPQHFTYLTEEILAERSRRGTSPSSPFVVWSAASSTGEEPYTLAIVLSEYAERQPLNWRLLATDISTAVLTRAARAVYAESSIAPVPDALKKKYFLRSRERDQPLVRAKPVLRQSVTFKRLNLLDRHYDVPRPLDVIFCRNVFIYFDRPTQERILRRFLDCLRPEGYIILGHSETINGLSLPMAQVAPTIYRKKS